MIFLLQDKGKCKSTLRLASDKKASSVSFSTLRCSLFYTNVNKKIKMMALEKIAVIYVVTLLNPR